MSYRTFILIIMIMHTHIALVLKKYNYKKKMALLTRSLGRIDVIYNQEILISAGILIHTEIIHTTHTIKAKNITLFDIPITLAKDDILFIHYILELIYYLAPIGSIEPSLFDLCLLLFSKEILTRLEKKYFICILFYVCGFSPLEMHKKIIKHHTSPIDIISQESLHLTDELTIDIWLKACIQEHPVMQSFKTRQFLSTHNLI